jgi:hypothetical protein
MAHADALHPARSPKRPALAVCAAAALLLAACESPDPLKQLRLTEVEGYWAVERPQGDTQLIAPAVRFRLGNQGGEPQRSIQATATFRRDGEEEAWSGAFAQASPHEGRPLGPGESRVLVLKPENEGRYKSPGAPEDMFQHPQFKDVRVEVYVRLGRSGWVKMAETPIERRIGSRSVPAEGR